MKLYGLRGRATSARKLPNEAKVKVYGLRGRPTSAQKLPNEAKGKLWGLRLRTHITRKLPNEAKAKRYGLRGCTSSSQKLPNEPKVKLSRLRVRISIARKSPNEAKVKLYGLQRLMTGRTKPDERTARHIVASQPSAAGPSVPETAGSGDPRRARDSEFATMFRPFSNVNLYAFPVRITGTRKLPNEGNVSLYPLHQLINRRAESAERSQFDQRNAKKCFSITNLLLKNAPNEPTGSDREPKNRDPMGGRMFLRNEPIFVVTSWLDARNNHKPGGGNGILGVVQSCGGLGNTFRIRPGDQTSPKRKRGSELPSLALRVAQRVTLF